MARPPWKQLDKRSTLRLVNIYICARDAFEYSTHLFDLVKARVALLSRANTAGCPWGKHGNAPF